MKCKITPENIQELKENEIFVFGSNLAGKHGAGAALLAKNRFGAKFGIGVGLMGQSYAFPTKNYNIQTLPIESNNSICIKQFVEPLLELIKSSPSKHFYITELGCGLAGYTPNDIAPLFKGFEELENCSLPQRFIDIICKPKIIRTYKMTDENMQCRGFQYELNKKYEIKGPIEICNKGFHSCQTPQQCLNYYDNNGKNRLFLCEIEINGNEDFQYNNDINQFNKIASDNITFIEELTDKMNILMNSGDWNSGNGNSGNRNSGNRNSGDWNSGNRNSGDWNSGDWNSGDLNSTNAPWRCFNKEQTSEKSDHYFPHWLYFEINKWVNENDLTDLEKEQHPYYKELGGALITKDYKQAAQESYNNATKSEQDAIEKLPSYDAQVLFDIFGIDRRLKS